MKNRRQSKGAPPPPTLARRSALDPADFSLDPQRKVSKRNGPRRPARDFVPEADPTPGPQRPTGRIGQGQPRYRHKIVLETPQWGIEGPNQKIHQNGSLPKQESPNNSIAALDKKYLWHPFTQQSEWEKGDPIVVRSARGSMLTDTRGRTYIDGVSSLWVTAHGHRHPALDRAVRRQLSRMAHTTFLGLTHEPAARLGKALVDIAPQGLERVFYSDNGATSVEVALKMAFQYWAHRGEHRSEYLALAGSYHGDTLGAVSVGGIAAFHKTFRPLLFKSHFAPAPHCYRCPFRKNPPVAELRTGDEPTNVRAPRPGDQRAETGCRWECLAGAEKILKMKRRRLAAAIVEPIVQGASGMRVMPRGYLKGFERLCRKNGVLLIADEVATGFGRTGRMFAVEQEDVRPDFLCVAKALTGGYLPLAATLTTQKIYKTFLGRYEEYKTFFHGHSYTANPLACAVALENLKVFKREKTLKRLDQKRQWMTEYLKEIADHPNVGHVRQAGFMAGIELVADKATHRPFPASARMGATICREALHKGAWLRPLGDVIVLMPPLGINQKDWATLTAALGLAQGHPSGNGHCSPK